MKTLLAMPDVGLTTEIKQLIVLYLLIIYLLISWVFLIKQNNGRSFQGLYTDQVLILSVFVLKTGYSLAPVSMGRTIQNLLLNR